MLVRDIPVVEVVAIWPRRRAHPLVTDFLMVARSAVRGSARGASSRRLEMTAGHTVRESTTRPDAGLEDG